MIEHGRWPAIVGSLEILLDSWGRLVGDFVASFEQDWREFVVRLSGQPKTEVLVRVELLEVFFEGWQPAGDEMEILEAEPHAFLGSFFEHADGEVILTTSHGKLLEVVSADFSFGEFFEFFGRIRTGGSDEEDWSLGSGFFTVDGLEGERVGRDGLDIKSFADEVCQGTFNSVGAEDLSDEDLVEGGDALGKRLRERLFAFCGLVPRDPNLVTFELKVLGKSVEVGGVVGVGCLTVFGGPAWEDDLGFDVSNGVAEEEVPFVWLEEVGFHALDDVETEHKSVLFE